MNEPLPLNKLPQYLRENNTLDPNSSVLVDIGQITSNKQSNGLDGKRYFYLFLILVLFGSISSLYMINKSSIIQITTNQEEAELNKILNENGAQILAVEKNKDCFLVKIKTKNKKEFLVSLKKNKDIISVEEKF